MSEVHRTLCVLTVNKSLSNLPTTIFSLDTSPSPPPAATALANATFRKLAVMALWLRSLYLGCEVMLTSYVDIGPLFSSLCHFGNTFRENVFLYVACLHFSNVSFPKFLVRKRDKSVALKKSNWSLDAVWLLLSIFHTLFPPRSGCYLSAQEPGIKVEAFFIAQIYIGCRKNSDEEINQQAEPLPLESSGES